MYTKINEKDSAMKLGAIYSKEKTTFTLFSPVADSVFVIFYDKGNDSAETGRLPGCRACRWAAQEPPSLPMHCSTAWC